MTNPSPAKVPKPFVFQAAIASLGAPVIAIVLSMATQSALREEPRSLAATLIVAIACQMLLVIGFTCSLIALFGIRRHGKKGLLGKGLGGLALNGVFLLASAFIFFWNPAASLYPKYAGLWTIESPPGAIQLLELRPDRQFHLTMTGTRAADVTGEWHLQFSNQKLLLVMKAQHVADGAPDLEGKDIVMEVDRYESDALHIISSDGPKVYHRKAAPH